MKVLQCDICSKIFSQNLKLKLPQDNFKSNCTVKIEFHRSQPSACYSQNLDVCLDCTYKLYKETP